MLIYNGDPTNHVVDTHAVDELDVLQVGGNVIQLYAKQQLNIGDFVILGHDLKADKTLSSSRYQSRTIGVVVGGQQLDNKVMLDASIIGMKAAAANEKVIVMRRGICYAIADTTGILKSAPITAGRTTAGRVRGDMLVSMARSAAGLAIKAGASAVVKAVNVTQTTVAGIQGTATAANLDQAALSGTVVNATHNVFELRVAADGTTLTSAMGTAGVTRDAIVFPTGSATLAVMGWVFINPTGTGNFVGGTTALDDGTVVPNAVYVDNVGFARSWGRALQDGGAAASALLVAVDCI